MRTIVEPKEQIDKLWGKQRVHKNAIYRLMRYVLRVDHDGKVLLHNVVTGRLVVLEQAEAEVVDAQPKAYEPIMKQLVTEHYLVPTTYDEYQQVANLRVSLRMIEEVQRPKAITNYTILPTTSCNARCYYCYEQGLSPITMTADTANQVVEFISKRHQQKQVWIRWFGGEPTLAVGRIDQICKGLCDRGIEFASRITTNGYLLDDELINRMKSKWNLRQVMISLDGSERSYNRIKAYSCGKDNAYQRVLRNIASLIHADVHVALRMNFDMNEYNYHDFVALVDDMDRAFGRNKLLRVTAHQINPHYPGADPNFLETHEHSYSNTLVELNDLLRARGYAAMSPDLPHLHYGLCSAARDTAVVILPDGSLVRCPDQLSQNCVIGNVYQGVTEADRYQSWKSTIDYERCRVCDLFPECVKIVNCHTKGVCFGQAEMRKRYAQSIIECYNNANLSLKGGYLS